MLPEREGLELEGNSWDRDEGGCLLWRPNGSAPVRGRGWAVGAAGLGSLKMGEDERKGRGAAPFVLCFGRGKGGEDCAHLEGT